MVAAASSLILTACGDLGEIPRVSPDYQESNKDSYVMPIGQDYPAHSIYGVIQWGEGGGTDVLMRPLAKLAQDKLGQEILLENMSGGTGSIALQYVYDQEADGYSLLMGAENPLLYDALGIVELTYSNFECVLLIGDETTAVTVGAKSPYQTLGELCEAAKSGESITMAITGTGGLPWEVGAMISGVTGAEFSQVQYDSDASAKRAVLSGKCDFTVCKLQACLEEYREGKMKLLCMLSEERQEQVPEVPTVTEEYPEFATYLPWGPFYGIFVREGTEPARIDFLSEAFHEAFDTPVYQRQLSESGVNPMGLTGESAKEYLDTWRTNTLNALKSSGALPE